MNPTVLRMIDANANRAREALRVVEDYARFGLNDDGLCEQLKHVRHDLVTATRAWTDEAIQFRDTPGDVGTAIKTSNEMSRVDLGAVVTAAGKRFGEALRVIEESSKVLDPQSALQVEAIRYRFYSIEQAIARTISLAPDFSKVKLYVLITASICTKPWQEAARLAIEGGADCLQLREKELEGGEFLKRAKEFVAICRAAGVISIINDRIDIAQLSDADGVHLGQGDVSCIDARKLLGRKKLIGVSTHEIAQARQAQRDGADYIGVGPIFPSKTKPREISPGLDYAREVAREIKIPAVGIAGITIDNAQSVVEAGLKAVAVTGAVVGQPDIREAARKLKLQLS